jgi:hypothetical protein
MITSNDAEESPQDATDTFSSTTFGEEFSPLQEIFLSNSIL